MSSSYHIILKGFMHELGGMGMFKVVSDNQLVVVRTYFHIYDCNSRLLLGWSV